jgi:general secretion pathway protein I
LVQTQSDDGTRGFTLLEVVVAIAIVAVALGAIGSLVSSSSRGTRLLEQRVALAETSRAILGDLSIQDAAKIGTSVGATGGQSWRVDVSPFVVPSTGEPRGKWVPLMVVLRVQSPGGSTLQVNTVRLRRRRE